jgi:hypothetical protein
MTMTNDATRATADQFHAVAEAAQAYFDLLYTSDIHPMQSCSAGFSTTRHGYSRNRMDVFRQ